MTEPPDITLRDILLHMQGMEKRLTDRMDGFDARMDGFDARMGGFDSRMGGLEQRIDRMERNLTRQIQAIDERLDALEIETLPKRGYRFVAPILADPTPPASVARIPETVESPGLPTASKRRWLAYVALLLAAGAAAGWYAIAARHAPIRVAVVPFDNETGQDSYDGLGRGVADATVARLAAPGRVERLDVIGNSAALRRPRSFRDLQEIGRDVKAEYVVLAQVKRDDTRVRLIAHLIRVKDEAHVWAHTYDRPEFTLAVQAEIAESIASAVSDKLLR